MPRALLILICLFASWPAYGQEFVMRISSPIKGDASNEWMIRFKEGVERRSGGQMRVELYPDNQLGQIPTTVEGVALGTIEMTIPAVGFLVGLDRRFQVLDVPDLFETVQHGRAVLSDPTVVAMMSEFGREKGVEALFTFVASPQMMLASEPVTSPELLKGLKIRAVGGAPLYIQTMRAFGANASPMPLGESMAALRNRAIDGMIAGLATYTNMKYYDIARDLTQLPGSYLVSVGLINSGFLTKIGPNLEAIVREEAKEAEIVFGDGLDADLIRLEKVWLENGGVVHRFTEPDQSRYREIVRVPVEKLLGDDPLLYADFKVLQEAAIRHRAPISK